MNRMFAFLFFVCLVGLGSSASYLVRVNLSNSTNENVSKLIFGMNIYQPYGKNNLYLGNYTVARMGGNSRTRFNYAINAANSASDYYFITSQSEFTWQTLYDQCIQSGISVMITQIPAMGWVAKTDTKCWSFSIQKYGPQQANECTNQPPGTTWCAHDAGNGIKPDGKTKITGNDPNDANMKTSTNDAQGFVKAVISTFGSSVGHIFTVDNEPTLWSQTHRDVHPNGSTYDEITGALTSYGAAIKEACNNECEVMGPSPWGWCGYFTDGADHDAGYCANGGPDRQAKGGLTLLQYYLQQAKQYEQQNNKRILDYLDVHFYAAAPNVAMNCQEDNTTSKNRLNAPRSLYDWSYTDPSWINQPIALIPRLQSWINQYYPGTKLSVSEYSFGGDTCVTSVLAHIEALAIFATYGVSVSTRWSKPSYNSLVVNAWKIFTNYDGQNSNVFDTYAVQTYTNNIDMITAYTLIKKDNSAMFIYIINKDPSNTNQALVSLENNSKNIVLNGALNLFVVDKNGLRNAGTVSPNNSTSFSYNIPPYTAVLAVAKL